MCVQSSCVTLQCLCMVLVWRAWSKDRITFCQVVLWEHGAAMDVHWIGFPWCVFGWLFVEPCSGSIEEFKRARVVSFRTMDWCFWCDVVVVLLSLAPAEFVITFHMDGTRRGKFGFAVTTGLDQLLMPTACPARLRPAWSWASWGWYVFPWLVSM